MVKQIGVNVKLELLKFLDEYVKEEGFNNRSEAIRFLIRQELRKWRLDNDR